MILKKKLAVLGLAAVMTVAFMPAMAFAGDTTSASGTTTKTTETTSTTSTNSIKTVPSDGSITEDGNYQLTDNLTHGITIASNKTVTLDLNGHNIAVSSGDAIVNGGTLTITGSGSVTAPRAAIGNIPGGTCTVEGGTYSSSSWYTIKNLGTMTIKNATITNADKKNHSSVIDNGWEGISASNDTIGGTYYNESSHESSATLTMTGGTITGNGINRGAVKNDDYGVFNMRGGTLDNTACTEAGQPALINWNEASISGGTITGLYAVKTGVNSTNQNKGKLTISGGNFINTVGDENIAAMDTPNTSAEKASITISGGNFNKKIKALNHATVSVTGGIFKNITASIIAENTPYAMVSSGYSTTYAVGEDTIAKAANDASNTVTIEKDSVTLTDANAEVKNAATNTGTVTVNGKTLSAGSTVKAGASQTISDLKAQITSLQNQLNEAKTQAVTSKGDADTYKAQVAKLQKELADTQALLKTAQEQQQSAMNQSETQKNTLTAPAQVTGLKAKAGKRYIKLSWTALQSNATGYRVYCKVKGGKYTKVKTITKAGTVSWTNKGLKKGRTYYYKVRAYKSISSGELWGAYSNTAKAKVK
ncbi:MAG: fibronectin type III domain-containing protein [Eubacterium sp.]